MARRLRGGPGRPRRRPRPPRCSPPSATGATWSRSPGTSPPSRAGTASPTCSAARSSARHPSGFATTEPPDEADGVVTAWFSFETAVGRGNGPAAAVRGRRGRAWTFLTDALRAQGSRGAARDHRPMGAEHGADKHRDLDGAAPGGGREPRHHHPALRAGRRRRPGRHRARRTAAPARRAGAGDRQAPAPRRPVAQPLQVAVPPRPGLVRPPALPEVPGQLAGLRAQGQDRRLARVLHAGHGGALLVQHRGHQRRPTPRRPRSGRSRSSARASR